MRDIVGPFLTKWFDLKNPAGGNVGQLLLLLCIKPLAIPAAAPAPAPPGALVSLEDTRTLPAPLPPPPPPPPAAAAAASAANCSADAKRARGDKCGFGVRFGAGLKSVATQKLLRVASVLQERQTNQHYDKLKED
eukprot:jgi/Mesen1/5786/ME000293S04942